MLLFCFIASSLVLSLAVVLGLFFLFFLALLIQYCDALALGATWVLMLSHSFRIGEPHLFCSDSSCTVEERGLVFPFWAPDWILVHYG